MSVAPSTILMSADEEEPIRLSGPPLALGGQLRVRNPNAHSLVLRDVALSGSSGRLAHLSQRRVFRPIVLRGGEERVVSVAIALDPLTAPGEYAVDLNLAGLRVRAVLSIEEAVALRISPPSIVVAGEPGATVRKTIAITNEGNVLLAIGEVGDVELRDDVAELHDFSGMIAPLLDEIPKNLEGVVAALVAITPRGLAAGHLRVRMPGETLRLPPGRTVQRELDITIPRELASHGRFRGRAAILTADLEFVVTPNAPAAREAPNPKAAQRAPQAKKSSR